MIYIPITPTQAQDFVSSNIGDFAIPAGLIWYWISGLHYYPQNRRNLFLVASEDGLCGVYGSEIVFDARGQKSYT